MFLIFIPLKFDLFHFDAFDVGLTLFFVLQEAGRLVMSNIRILFEFSNIFLLRFLQILAQDLRVKFDYDGTQL